jgi:hypothetical protein
MTSIKSLKSVANEAALMASGMTSSDMRGTPYFDIDVRRAGRHIELVFNRGGTDTVEASFSVSAFSGQIYDASIPWAGERRDWSDLYLTIDLDSPEETEHDTVKAMAGFLKEAMDLHMKAMSGVAGR